MPWPRLARVAFWEGVRAGLGVGEAAEAAGAARTAEVWFREATGALAHAAAGRLAGRRAGESPVSGDDL